MTLHTVSPPHAHHITTTTHAHHAHTHHSHTHHLPHHFSPTHPYTPLTHTHTVHTLPHLRYADRGPTGHDNGPARVPLLCAASEQGEDSHGHTNTAPLGGGQRPQEATQGVTLGLNRGDDDKDNDSIDDGCRYEQCCSRVQYANKGKCLTSFFMNIMTNIVSLPLFDRSPLTTVINYGNVISDYGYDFYHTVKPCPKPYSE